MSYVDIQNRARIAYVQKLSGNVSYEGTILPIRDSFARDTDQYPYIVVVDQTDTPLPESRSSFMRSVATTIEIVTAFPAGSTGARSQGEQIANQVYSLTMSKDSSDWLDFGQGIFLGDAEIDFSNTLTDTQTSIQGKRYIYRKIIRFRNDITMR